MCGISGIINLKGFDISNIKVMTDIIRHRGPDDEGFVVFENTNQKPVCLGGESTPKSVYHNAFNYTPVSDFTKNENRCACIAFGHRRLSILDLSAAGHQPMCDVDNRYWIVYNGEVYNYIELKAVLEKHNYKFTSHTDTEVILAAWNEWGPSCLEKFTGMWAICIYDSLEKKIFLARDRFGIKPLYYWFAPDGSFCFGSEIKQFTVLRGWRPVLNGPRAYDYLAYSYTDHTDETMFMGVFQIPAGHFLHTSLELLSPDGTGRMALTRWYKLQLGKYNGTFEEACESFKHLFKQSVQLHLRSDVPVGSALSGGLDSSAIVCEVNELLKKQNVDHLQKTFSACSHDERYDERKWVDIVTKQNSAKSFFVYPELKDVFETLPEMIWYHDEPYQSQSAYFAFNVFKLAKNEDVKVMLNGQGADEYLGGYGQFSHARLTNKTKKLQFKSIFMEAKKSQQFIPYSKSFLFKLVLAAFIPFRIKRILSEKLNKNVVIRRGLINQNLLKTENVSPNRILKMYEPTIADLSKDGLFHSTLPAYLKWEDRNSMANSIEARVPFLYHKLVEFVYNLPDEYLDYSGERKRVMREGLKSLLPTAIRERKDKNGFITSEEKWVKKDAPSLFRQKMQEAIENSLEIINPAALTYFDDVVNSKIPFDYTYWRLILFSAWLKEYNVKLN